jgi:hypothetical protein
VNHSTTPQFWEFYGRLPADIRDLADKNFGLLKTNPRHPSLHLKRTGRVWSVRVGAHYRALGLDKKETIVWFWIGPHAEYDKLLPRM